MEDFLAHDITIAGMKWIMFASLTAIYTLLESVSAFILRSVDYANIVKQNHSKVVSQDKRNRWKYSVLKIPIDAAKAWLHAHRGCSNTLLNLFIKYFVAIRENSVIRTHVSSLRTGSFELLSWDFIYICLVIKSPAFDNGLLSIRSLVIYNYGLKP